MRQVAFISGRSLWQRGHGPEHPLKPERLKRTHELLEEYGAFDLSNVRLVEPRQATDGELAYFHTREYVDVVRQLSAGDSSVPAGLFGFGPGDNPVFPGMYESEGRKVGSALQAAELLVSGECSAAFSYGGGLHHGGPNFASGFCVFNDAAVAIHWMLQQDLRVAYVDIDVHHGDGVQDAFYNSDQVLTISLHQDGRTLFPGTGSAAERGEAAGEGYCVNVPLPPNTDDETYFWAFEQIVPPMLTRFDADVVVTQLGVDTHFRDPLANLLLSTQGQVSLFAALNELAPRWLALGGGGYDMGVVPRAWALAFGIMSGQEWPEELPLGYSQRYGERWLNDQARSCLREPARQQIRRRVENTVAVVKADHGLD